MFDRIIKFAIEQRWLVMLLTFGLIVGGMAAYSRLALDALPDISPVQTTVNVSAPGYSPLEVEQRITFPLETVMAGLPGMEQTRSLSRYGLSQIVITFRDGTNIYFARQLVNERIQEAKDRLPPGITPAMGPISTGLGEIYLWTVEAKEGAKKPDGTAYAPMDLREIQDWVIKPQLRNVKGVAEINSIGGYAKEYQVAPNSEKLASYGITLAEIVTALDRNNSNLGAGYIERRGEQLLVRTPGQVRTLGDIGNIVVRSADGVPIRIRDVAEVSIGKELRTGAATENGQEVVLGTVFMLMGENSRTVAKAVDAKMADINRTLPEGVRAVTVYDRTVLVDKAIHTVQKNLLESAALVIAILFLFLGNIRAAIITAMVIPLSLLFTFSGMVTTKVSANLLSFGAVDLGLLADGAIVLAENSIKRLAHAQSHHGRALTRSERFHEVFVAAREVRRPLIFGQLIILVVFLPIFSLSGVEGRMFHPLALTVVMALVGAMILSFTFVPAAIALFMSNKVEEKENALVRGAKRYYAPLLNFTMANKPVVLTFAVVAVVLSGLLASRMGSEFVPSLNEGDFAIQAIRIPGTSLSQSVVMQQQLERALKEKHPEIERVFARTGTAEIASDPMPPNISDGYIMVKPESEWPEPKKSRNELLAAIQKTVGKLPGNNYEFSQPVQLRFNELISGIRSDVAVKLFGDDTELLNGTADRIADVLRTVPGASEVKVEQTTGLPMLTVQIDREQAARYGLNVGDVQEMVATAIGGKEAGTLFQGDRRFDIVVRLHETSRNDLEVMKRLPISLPSGKDGRTNYIPLGEVAKLNVAPGPNQISREDGKRRIVVSANVRGRDMGSFVADAEKAITAQVKVPSGYWTTWGGQFEQLQSASKRLQVVIPVALLMIFTLLFMMFGEVKVGLIVFSGIPFALTGGILALWLRGIPLSISAGVGFVALSGVAVLNGLVMVAAIRHLVDEGRSFDDAVNEGAMSRLRPVLMTALVASLGFIPMAIATGTGAEVQRPLATVVIGGIVSSTFLTLLVLPLLYRLAYGKQATQEAERLHMAALHPTLKPSTETL
jgi:cobalt-zinc-cadmium resistance protein CzcA